MFYKVEWTDKKTEEKLKRLAAFAVPLFLGRAFALTLGVGDAVNLALENNISIERSEITLNALKRADRHSWNSASPTISIGANTEVPIDALCDNDSQYSASFGVSATLSLNLSANLYTAVQTARHNLEIGEIAFNDAVKDVELSVRQTFYGLLYEKENITLQERNMDVARQQYETNLKKYNAGRLSELDVLSAEVSYKQCVPTVENARITYQNDLASFKRLLGIPLEEEVELEGDLDSLVFLDEINIDGIQVSSSTVKTLEKRVAAAENSVLDRRFSAYAPSLNASLKWNDQYWYAGYDGTAPDASKSATLTLSATIPLDGYLPWSTKSDNVEAAKDTLADYRLQLEDAETSLRISVDSYLRSIRQSQAAIKSKQANVRLAQKSYDMTYDAYSRGTKDLLSLQSANSTLLSAQLSLKSEIYTFLKNVMNLESAIGVGFGTLMETGDNR